MAKLRTVPTTRTKNKKGDDLRHDSYLKVVAPYQRIQGFAQKLRNRWRNT